MVAVVIDCSKAREGEDERGRGDGRKKRSGIEFVVYEASNSHHSKLRSNTW